MWLMLFIPKKHHAKYEIIMAQDKEVTKLESWFQLAKHHGTTSCHSKRPLVIKSTSYHRKDLLSSGVPLVTEVPFIIGKTFRHREYLLSLERPLLVAPLVVDSHFCQTWSVTVGASYHWKHSHFRRFHSGSCQVNICGLNFETVDVTQPCIRFSHSDNISKFWRSRTWFLRFCNQNRFEFQIPRDWKNRTFLPRDLQLSNFGKWNSYYCRLQILKNLQVCYVGYRAIAKRW